MECVFLSVLFLLLAHCLLISWLVTNSLAPTQDKCCWFHLFPQYDTRQRSCSKKRETILLKREFFNRHLMTKLVINTPLEFLLKLKRKWLKSIWRTSFCLKMTSEGLKHCLFLSLVVIVKKTPEIVIYDMSHRQLLQIWSNFFV